MINKLKPCPFCGEVPIIINRSEVNEQEYEWNFGSLHCAVVLIHGVIGCPCRHAFYHISREDVIKRWNKYLVEKFNVKN